MAAPPLGVDAPDAPQISIHVATYAPEDPGSWEPMLDRVRAADRAGIDRVAVSDHVVFGEDLDAYGRPELGGRSGGKQPTGPDGHWLEPLTVLAMLAGMTSRVRLCTHVLQAALRRPVVLAKQAATIDVLSGGRLDLGVGVGWQREEYDAAGLDFAARGEALDETLAVCRLLWREQRASYRSGRLRFEAIHLMPKPLQVGGVPIWVSGTVNRRVVRRLMDHGSGWIPWGPAAADVRTGIAQMKDSLAAAGGDASDLQVLGQLPVVHDGAGAIDVAATMAVVPERAAWGVSDFRIALPQTSLGLDAACDYLAPIVEGFRVAAGRPLD